MVSRLDRLFILLDTGSNESVRLAAAKQLGEVQRVQPNELNYLLNRIKEYSCKSVWETRVAAGHATRCVLEQVQQANLLSQTLEDEAVFEVDDKLQKIAQKLIDEQVDTERVLQQFDIDKLLSLGLKFLSLDVNDQAEIDSNTPLVNPSTSRATTGAKNTRATGRRKGIRGQSKKGDNEHLMRQRKLINKELGISMVDSLNLGVSSTDIVSNDDLQIEYDSSTKTTSLDNKDSKAILQSSFCNYDNIFNSLTQHDCLNPNQMENSSSDHLLWSLANISNQYSEDLFNASWEYRHGAAIALREIVRMQGKHAGRIRTLSDHTNETLNQVWLVDMALRAISLLALDRFGDFLFDQVVAPVRENGAQLLGCCVSNMTQANASLVVGILTKMLTNSSWETRHGGILGLKYSLNALDENLAKRLLKHCFDSLLKCLADPVDDVSAEAAAALVPIKDLMIDSIPERAPELIKFLWDHLADLDELTTSTSNIVLLLASLITSSCAQLETSELIKSIPRLWGLLNHSSTSVRLSVLKALVTLIKPQPQNCLTWMPDELMSNALRLIYQRSILENMDDVRKMLEDVWAILIRIDDSSLSTSNSERFRLLKSTSQYLNYWLCLIMQPSTTPIDRGSPMWLNINPDGSLKTIKPDGEVYIGSCTFNAESMNLQKLQVTKCRSLATKLIGGLYAHLTNDFTDTQEAQHAKNTLNYLSDMFVHYMDTKSAQQRIISGWTLESWANSQSILIQGDESLLRSILPEKLRKHLNAALLETFICYDELASAFTRLQQEARDFVATLKRLTIDISFIPDTDKKTFYNLAQIQSLCDFDVQAELTRLASKKTLIPKLDSNHDITRTELFKDLVNKKSNLTKSLNSTQSSQKSLSTSVLSSLSYAHISWKLSLERLELLADPLLESIEQESDPSIQEKSADYLVILIEMLLQNHEKGFELVNRILNRLVLTLDSSQTSNFNNGSSLIAKSIGQADSSNGSDTGRIILLDNLRRQFEKGAGVSRRHSLPNQGSLKRSHQLSSTETCEIESSSFSDSFGNDLDIYNFKYDGVTCALKKLVTRFSEDLPTKLPKLWDAMTGDIANLNSHGVENQQVDGKNSDLKLTKSLRLLEVVGDSLSKDLQHHLLDLLPPLIKSLRSKSSLVRHHSSQCIGIITKLMFFQSIDLIKNDIIPMLDSNTEVISRSGAIEAIASIIEHLQLNLLPHINMFIVHVLRRISDQDNQVRLMATHCFGKLLSLMPLNPEKSNLDQQNLQGQPLDLPRDSSDFEVDYGKFMEQLLDPKKLENYVVPFQMKVELRSYQQDGLNWLAFMNRFNLHGILCDDMGLGKTFMTICMVASDHYCAHKRKSKSRPTVCPPSLIVCPSTLTEHWLYELDKFLTEDVANLLEPIAYFGSINERVCIRNRIKGRMSENTLDETDGESQRRVGLVVASYDIVRNDIEFFQDIHWNYCVLDEGHIIKNGKTKLSRSIKLLKARHRLILSGTPIQNNVTELWSLFDFLMPGFLGSERQFNARYAKPILQSREVKCSPRELEAGALAIESLHRQVLPFILRRLKEDVLDDLPPKIIQDYYCEMSPLQNKLYEDFTRSRLCNDVTKKSIHRLNSIHPAVDLKTDQADMSNTDLANSRNHVFQALQYLKNVCNHPKLVLSEKHSQYAEIKKSLGAEKSSLDDISHSSKLKALKQLLIDCGIGISFQSGEDCAPTNLAIESVVNQHRALIFCQIRSMINIIEEDLLKKHLPSVTYLKLDGSVPANQRHSVVARFNNDPSIDVLLLTTQIGGLGLNLTGADTVIFVEHDWNPTKDLQAMDRAHRIGQKRVVNVYRLITKNTLEEKIMGLQKFKTMVSNTVINQDNTGLSSMGVDQLLDLFEVEPGQAQSKSRTDSTDFKDSSGKARNRSALTDMLPELWDRQQYEDEYDLSTFVSSLKS